MGAELGDVSLPQETLTDGHERLWRGTFICVTGVVLNVTAFFVLMVSPERLVQSACLAWLGASVFGRGDSMRWDAILSLSPLVAYRRRRGYQVPDAGQIPSQAFNEEPFRSSVAPAARGAIVIAAGTFLLISGGRGLQAASTGEWPAWSIPIGLVFLLLGVVYVGRGNTILRQGRGHYAHIILSPRALTPGSYVLYLRSFGDDYRLSRPQRVPGLGALVRAWISIGRSEEERLNAAMRWAGPMVAVGAPGEQLPPVGATRVYLPPDDWQQPVRDMMRGARLVVIGLGHGAGTLWELGEAMRILPAERLLLLVPMGREEYESFRARAEAELRKQADRQRRVPGGRWVPPTLPDYQGHRTMLSSIQGLIYFTSQWDATFVSLDRPPLPEDHLIGALDRALRPVVVQLTQYEQQTEGER